MTKSELVKMLTARRGSDFMSLRDVCGALHIGNDKAHSLLDGLDFLELGNGRRYSVSDVADRLLSMRRR